MKLEYLILVTENEFFCSSKESFINFLQIDSSISVNDQKMVYRTERNGKELVSANFHVETGIVESKRERYFLLVLTCNNKNLIDEFSELGEKIKTISSRICPGLTRINTLWDDVGRIYAERAYPLINEIENLMRRLISKFMLINVGMEWSKDRIDNDLFQKIQKYEDEELYLNDLSKLDFIHLKQVLFQKKRDISLEELDRVLIKTSFNEEDKSKILKYVPRSNWEKYFSTIIEEKDKSFEAKWEIIYKLRNKVAHNRYLKKDEFEKIKGLCSTIKEIINRATNKLGEINLDQEDRQSIIHSYQSNSPTEYYAKVEEAVAEYYNKSGYNIVLERFVRDGVVDFYAAKESEKIAVEIKVRSHTNLKIERALIDRLLYHSLKCKKSDTLTRIDLVIILRDYDIDQSVKDIHSDLMNKFSQELIGEEIVIKIGYINEVNQYVCIQ
ncbi:hypothetical protein [Nostoc sp.]|uniref:hypothetical protein n=1 Tax=Nostoc sp. TaxID=1180 RepID=UPI002FFA232D